MGESRALEEAWERPFEHLCWTVHCQRQTFSSWFDGVYGMLEGKVEIGLNLTSACSFIQILFLGR